MAAASLDFVLPPADSRSVDLFVFAIGGDLDSTGYEEAMVACRG